MKTTTKTANGTSFHGTMINCTVQTLKDILGTQTYGNNDGQDKVNYEWVMETKDGDVFTVYDWKEYRSLNDTDMIEWHIGGHDKHVTEQAKNELTEAVNGYNNPIHIVYYSETVDNYGRQESSSKGGYIYNALMNMVDWTDDMIFEDSIGNTYFIDNLIGKTVKVNDIGIFTIPNENK
jgi:hypothetical protein